MYFYIVATKNQKTNKNIPFTIASGSKTYYIQGKIYKLSLLSKNGIWDVAEFFHSLKLSNLGILSHLDLI